MEQCSFLNVKGKFSCRKSNSYLYGRYQTLIFLRKGRFFVEQVEKDSLKRFTQIKIVEVLNGTPETTIRVSTFGIVAGIFCA